MAYFSPARVYRPNYFHRDARSLAAVRNGNKPREMRRGHRYNTRREIKIIASIYRVLFLSR